MPKLSTVFSKKTALATKARPRFSVKPPPRKLLIKPPADWSFPRRTIMVVGVQRSGTTYLCGLMTGTGVLGRPDEYLHTRRALRIDPQRGDDVAFQLSLPNTLGRTENGTAALKLFPFNIDRIFRQANLFDFYPDPVFIFVRRRDTVSQAVSYARALQTGGWRSNEPVQEKPRYSAHEIHGALVDLMISEARWKAYFARNGIEPLELFYEDILGNEERSLREIARHADLEEVEHPLHFEPVNLSVQRDEISAEWRARFLAERADPNWLERRPRKYIQPTLKKFLKLLRGNLYS